MKYNIKCLYNSNHSPNHKTIFEWKEYTIELDYNYDSDICITKVNGENYSIGNDEILDPLIDALQVTMTDLEWEECKQNDIIDFDPNDWL